MVTFIIGFVAGIIVTVVGVVALMYYATRNLRWFNW